MIPTAPFGGKVVGEPPITPAVATIANAIFNATGKRFKELPITPDKIVTRGPGLTEKGAAMKSFENIDVKSVKEAVGLLQKFHQQKKTAAVVGGGSEYLQLMKDHVVEPDYLD